jgi:hypothetical protein
MADGLTVLRHVCKAKTQSECTKEFFKLHQTSLAYVKVDGDGNCFFRSLSAYYELHPELSIDGVHDPTNFHELRQYIVKKLKHQLETREEIREFLPYIDNRPLDIILSELATTCIFDIPIFELMTERVSTILNINLNLYRVNIKIIDPDKDAKGDNIILSISESFYKPDPGIHANATISIFLASYHYGLVIPNSDSAYTEAVELSKKQKKSAVSKKDYISKKEQELINAAIANSMKKYNSSAFGVFNNEKVNNSMVAKKLQMEYNAKLAQELQQLSIGNSLSPNLSPQASPKKASSSPKKSKKPMIGSFNAIKLAEKQYAYTTITADIMHELLINCDIELYRNEKETLSQYKTRLYNAFIPAIASGKITEQQVKIAKSAKSKKHGGTLKKKKYARSASRKNKRR